MPYGTITSTENTFGTVNGALSGTVAGTLSGSVGVPGQQGEPGPQGPQGDPGEGVPSGGSTGQALVKLDGTDYNTGWSSLPDFLTKAGNLDGLTNRATARDNLNLGDANQPTFFGVDIYGSGSNAAHLGAPFLTLIDPMYGEFVIQPSSGITFPDASTQTTAWNDAPSDGTIYGRQDGYWVEAGGGDYLPLAGGAMDANASITASDTSTASDSEVAGWGLGVQLSADHTKGTTVEFDGLDAYDGASHMQVTPTGITFPDATTQTTAGIEEAPMDNKPYVRFNGVWMVPPYNYVGSITMIGTDIVNTSSWYGAPFYLGRNGNVIANSDEFGNELYIGGSSGYDKSSSTYPYLNQLTLCSNFGFDHSLATNPPNIDGWNSLRNIAMTYNSFVTAPNCGEFDLLTLVLDQNEYMATAPYFTNTSSLYQVSMLGCSVSSSELLSCLSQIYNLGGAANNGYFDCSGGNNGALDPSAIEITQLQDAGWTITFNSI